MGNIIRKSKKQEENKLDISLPPVYNEANENEFVEKEKESVERCYNLNKLTYRIKEEQEQLMYENKDVFYLKQLNIRMLLNAEQKDNLLKKIDKFKLHELHFEDYNINHNKNLNSKNPNRIKQITDIDISVKLHRTTINKIKNHMKEFPESFDIIFNKEYTV